MRYTCDQDGHKTCDITKKYKTHNLQKLPSWNHSEKVKKIYRGDFPNTVYTESKTILFTI